MLDYPPESLFDDFILQEENECLLERTEDEKLEIEAIDKIAPKIQDARELYDLGYIFHIPIFLFFLFLNCHFSHYYYYFVVCNRLLYRLYYYLFYH